MKNNQKHIFQQLTKSSTNSLIAEIDIIISNGTNVVNRPVGETFP